MPEKDPPRTDVTAAAGWFDDPTGAHEMRYWDGDEWTDHVADGGVSFRSPSRGAPTAAVPAPAIGTPLPRSRPLFKTPLLILLVLLFVGVPVVVGIVAVASRDPSNSPAVEPFDNPDAACEAWWRTNVAAAREGWADARFRTELRRLADATENIDAQLATLLRNVVSASDAAAVGENSQEAYQRCVGLHRWRGATEEELSIMANPSRPPR